MVVCQWHRRHLSFLSNVTEKQNKLKSHSHPGGYSLLPAPCITDTNTLISGVGVLPYIRHLGVWWGGGGGGGGGGGPPPPPPFKGMVFAPCWSENGYTFCPFWSGIGYGLRGNYGSVWTYLLFQIQMNTGKERLMYVDFKKSFILCSNLSNDDIIS